MCHMYTNVPGNEVGFLVISEWFFCLVFNCVFNVTINKTDLLTVHSLSMVQILKILSFCGL